MSSKKDIRRLQPAKGRRWHRLAVVCLAALLLEAISGVQYLLTHRMLDSELEKRAESELTLKAILIKSNLKDAEDIVSNSLWKIQAHLDQPDSAFITMRRLVSMNPNITGAGLGFVPDYYPDRGLLYEVYARRTVSGEVEARQIGGDRHDYTRYDFYRQATSDSLGRWTDPYDDKEGARGLVTTYSKAIYDRRGRTAGAVGIDMSVKWLSDTINLRHIYPSSFILVLTESGQPVILADTLRASAKTQEYVCTLIADSTANRDKSSSGRSTVIKFDNAGRDGTIFYASMRGLPHWTIVVVCYDDEAFAPLTQLRLWMLILMFAAFGILLYVVWRFARGERRMESTSLLLKQKTEEQEHMDAELRIANGIQQALLPSNEPTLQGVTEVQVEGRLIPAKAVGGDLYNVFVRDGKLFFCIGDVSGKGVPAALIMAVTQALFHNIASREDNPAHIMEQLNATACRNNKSNMFATLFIGVLNLPTGHLSYCNAGHELPIFLSPQPLAEPNTKANLPIGLFDDFTYEKQETIMTPGSTLFLYTDGLTEARNASRGLYGRKRVGELMARCSGMMPKEMVGTVISEVEHFTGDTELSDDLTLLAIRYTPPERPLVLDERLSLQNDVKQVSRLGSFIKDIMERLGIGKPLAPKMRLALEEAVVNVMEYAYPVGVKGDVTIRVTYDGERLRFIITDSGTPFNPTKVSAADTTLSAEERPVGGLGILLIREVMDFINYERVEGRNVLTLTKKTEPLT